ncbi:hypothetical protein [[Leptolyngbya] sp. PCC 7376]|uniref:hypothetical protein n=1 Tax=[Leptolyngbya] sp. PCC 7376 TaxID=111781 RepID=UPI0002F02E8A|nr:hypothetical protein [[Leptolyngbya] sp. PCC 7376]
MKYLWGDRQPRRLDVLMGNYTSQKSFVSFQTDGIKTTELANEDGKQLRLFL